MVIIRIKIHSIIWIVREDLLLSMSQGLNRVTDKMEKLGLVILKDENGEYIARGNSEEDQ